MEKLTKDELNYLAERIALRIKGTNTKEYVSQRAAYREFGEACVKKWVDSGEIQRHFRTNKIEYKYVELLALKAKVYDHK